MLHYDRKSMDAFAAPAREMFEAWISLFPTAPLFGVPWRFAPDFSLFTEIKAPRPYVPRIKADATDAETVAPAPVADEPVAAAPANDGGNVVQIRGIGPRLAAELAEMGINTVADLAALSNDDLARIDAQLTTIKGRCYRDDWVGQAKALLAGA